VVLHKAEVIDDNIYNSLKKDLDEIIRILIATIKTAKNNKNNEDTTK
jgi:hypothetical protein